jgi:flagellar biosynthesis protein FliR
MTFDEALLFAFLLVFVRCSAMLLSSPVFGAQNTPLPIRILTTLAISAALTCAIQPHIGPLPKDLYSMGAAVAGEAVAGLLIGLFMQLALQAALMAGALLDTQIGLGMSQTLNPIAGVPISIIAQYKFMLAVVVFLSINGHHVMLEAFARSYELMPTVGAANIAHLQEGYLGLLGQVSLLSLTIAAPVLAVSLVVDAALGVVSKAVPQMQAIMVGLPAKLIMGMTALSLALPALASGVQVGVEQASDALFRVMRAG